jgi:insulysin
LEGGDASTNEVETERRVASKILGPIIKPPTDEREYRGLVLSNGMKVLLISDPHTSKAAASLAVSAGSMSDPPDLFGLAHFVEHMLFLGNEKFPKENAFQKFLSEHGGSSNAGTQADETYYFFRVASPFFKDALER